MAPQGGMIPKSLDLYEHLLQNPNFSAISKLTLGGFCASYYVNVLVKLQSKSINDKSFNGTPPATQ